jgi:hypothetical protein
MTECPKPNVYPGVDFPTYRSWGAVNNSLLWTLKSRSPLHAKYERENPEDPTDDMVFGQQLHALVLEPAAWDARYVVCPPCDKRTTAGKAVYAEFQSSQNGREEVSHKNYEKMVACAGSVRAATCAGLVKGGRNELCLVWDDPETGVRMKARCDCVHEDTWDGDIIVDVKTTASAREEDFRQSIRKYGYFMQAAIYCAGWEVLTGHTPEFTILAVEKKPPFAVAAYPLGPKTMDAGRIAFRRALAQYIECEKSGRWPGYQPDGPTVLDLSDYHLGMEGVSPFQVVAEPAYVGGGVPEGHDVDEIDEFLKGE